jgi:hypothetical protein
MIYAWPLAGGLVTRGASHVIRGLNIQPPNPSKGTRLKFE